MSPIRVACLLGTAALCLAIGLGRVRMAGRKPRPHHHQHTPMNRFVGFLVGVALFTGVLLLGYVVGIRPTLTEVALVALAAALVNAITGGTR